LSIASLKEHIHVKHVNATSKRYLNGKHVPLELGCGLHMIQPVLCFHGMISTWPLPPALLFFDSPLPTYNTRNQAQEPSTFSNTMAPTHHHSKDAHNKSLTVLGGLKGVLEQMSAHSEALLQDLRAVHMRLDERMKKHTENSKNDHTAALHRSVHQVQKAMEDRLAHLLESAAKELPASIKNSGVLMVGEGEVDDEARKQLAEKVKEVLSLMRASTEDMESVIQQSQDITKPHNMNFYNVSFDGVTDTAYGVNYTRLFPLADRNSARVTVANCRMLAVASCNLQADYSCDETNVTLARELAKCDALAVMDIFETGLLAGTLAVLFVIGIMICSAFRLLSERQAHVFGLGVVAVCLIVHFGGI
jgi:hypothetical protein